MKIGLFAVIAAVSLILFEGACSRDKFVMGNEGLRLTPEEIKRCKYDAGRGDSEAAKKLWHHYEFVEYNYSLGEQWYAEYKRLRKVKKRK